MTTTLQTGMVFFLSVSIAFTITACSKPATLDLEVIVPEQGADPFEGASKVTIRAGDKESSSTIDEAGQSFDTKVTLPLGTQTTVSLEGRDSSGRLLCSGTTPPLYAVGNSETLRLWVSRRGAWSLHPAKLDKAITRPSMVTYEQTVWETLDHQPLYTFWFGGCDESGLPVDSVGYFDPYYQTIVTYPGLGDQNAWTDPATPVEPRCGAAAMSLPDGAFIIFGGQDDSGLPTDEFDLAVASGAQFNYTAIPLECADGQDNDSDGLTDEDDEDCASRWDASERPDQDWAVAFPQVATLGPYASLWDDTVYRITTSFLLLGGRGVDGPSDMALHLLAEQTADGLSYRFRIEPMTMFAARAGHCAAAGLLREGDMETRTVLVVGGTGDATDGVAAEYFQFKHDTSTSAMDWEWTHERLANDDQGDPLPLLYDAACAEVSRGRILACGGKTADGLELSRGDAPRPGGRGRGETHHVGNLPGHGKGKGGKGTGKPAAARQGGTPHEGTDPKGPAAAEDRLGRGEARGLEERSPSFEKPDFTLDAHCPSGPCGRASPASPTRNGPWRRPRWRSARRRRGPFPSRARSLPCSRCPCSGCRASGRGGSRRRSALRRE